MYESEGAPALSRRSRPKWATPESGALAPAPPRLDHDHRLIRIADPGSEADAVVGEGFLDQRAVGTAGQVLVRRDEAAEDVLEHDLVRGHESQRRQEQLAGEVEGIAQLDVGLDGQRHDDVAHGAAHDLAVVVNFARLVARGLL